MTPFRWQLVALAIMILNVAAAGMAFAEHEVRHLATHVTLAALGACWAWSVHLRRHRDQRVRQRSAELDAELDLRVPL